MSRSSLTSIPLLRAAAAAVLVVAALTAHALDVPPAPTQWFTDRASVVSAADAEALNQKLAQFEQTSGAQFIIYILPSLEGDPVEDFTIRAVEKWKVGQKKYDNGLVLFVFVQEKKVRVEVGYGLEGTVTDAFSSRVIRDQIAPFFRQGNYAGGLNAAADAIIKKISTGEEPVAPMQRGGRDGKDEVNPIVVLIILFVVFFVVLPMLSRGGRRGGCNGCILPFIFPGGGSGITFGGRGGGFGGGFGGGGFGGFSGGGGGFGGGGATGGW